MGRVGGKIAKSHTLDMITNKQTTCSPFQVKEIVGSLVEDIKIPSISDLPGRSDMH